MWMMGCNDVGGDQDSLNGRKLRPFMPITAASAARNHGTDHFLALNHHLLVAEDNKRELMSTQQVVVSSRWNPTPEQLETLEEVYRRGVRTPSADQIQHITTQLRRYGKIEGKNVFYWFQNHKARERQKRRRQLDDIHDLHKKINHIIPISQRKNQSSSSSPGENGTLLHTCNNKLASPKKSSSIIEQKSMPTRGAEGSKADGWVHFNEETELEERRNPSNWQMLNLSSSYNSSSPSPNNLIYYSFPNSSATHHVDTNPLSLDQQCYGAAGCLEEQTTLQLFPVRSGCRSPCNDDDEDDRSIVVNYDTTASTNVAAPDHYQFFEFLPLKK
ncbi:uncharacterized protein [Henckelia pumila]|uniref:uncharacterized protein n=1 Tax=Henckelia pumila TaxID=405737 RepID=UPI003C6E7B3F